MVGVLTALELFVGVGLLFANGFFVTMEYALTRLRQFPEHELGSDRLERAWEMTERLEIYLSSSKLGITVMSIGLGVIAEPALAETLTAGIRLAGIAGGTGAAHAASASILAFAIITLLHVIVGEQAPTYLGVERPKLVSAGGGLALRLWTRATSPAIRFGDWVAKATLGLVGVEITRSWTDVEEEDDLEGDALLSELEAVLDRSDLTAERREEIVSALEISHTTVGEVMVPRDEIVTLRRDASLTELLERIEDTPHTRYPVVEDGIGDVVGILYVSALLQEFDALQAGEVTVQELLVEPFEVDPDVVVSDLIDRLQAADQEMAVVTSGGRVAGVVTVTDAFEAITGELEDPFDEEEVTT